MKIKTFGVAKDIVGASEFEIHNVPDSVADLRQELEARFPKLAEIKSYAIAVNEEYVNDGDKVEPGDTIVIIPPVSGG